MDGRWAHNYVPTLTDDFFESHGLDKTTTFFPEEEEEWLGYTSAHISSPYGLLR